MKQGLIHIYTGNGKGKTSAAIGLCARAAGHGMKVCFVQFLKTAVSGEEILLEKGKNITFYKTEFEGGFVWEMNESQKKELSIKTLDLWEDAKKLSQDCNLLVLDEIMGAITCGFIDTADIAFFLKNKPKSTEVVLTGRQAPKELVDAADYVSEIVLVKHPFEKGTAARLGIEF